jgi:hypothetical protein
VGGVVSGVFDLPVSFRLERRWSVVS